MSITKRQENGCMNNNSLSVKNKFAVKKYDKSIMYTYIHRKR